MAVTARKIFYQHIEKQRNIQVKLGLDVNFINAHLELDAEYDSFLDDMNDECIELMEAESKPLMNPAQNLLVWYSPVLTF